MDDMEEFKATFFTECSELLVDMEERLLKLEVGVFDKDALNAIFRCAHSIKGGSGAFGMNRIMNFTHILEALLDKMREGEILPSQETVDVLLKSADAVVKMLEAEKSGSEAPADLETGLAVALQNFTNGNAAVKAIPLEKAEQVVNVMDVKDKTYIITFAPQKELFTTGNEPLLLLRELAGLGSAEVSANIDEVPDLENIEPTSCYIKWDIKLKTDAGEDSIWEVFEFVRDVAEIKISIEADEIIHSENTTSVTPLSEEKVAAEPLAATSPVTAAAGEAQKEASKDKNATTTSIRVDLEKVDKLVNMVGELVITEAMLKAQAKFLAPDAYADLLRGIEELSHHTREIQEAVMSVRMQPVKSIFSRMPRIVRDTASQLGKDIQLILSGENTEVDKTVIEQLGDPLTHMIRNSVDHGIEAPDQRIWNDKPLQGTIHLSAYQRSGRIIIEIQDDGAGINRTRVLAKAIEKGLVAPDAQLSDEEIDHLIFMPGFSTAEKVTSVSGRGVGMDVVRRNIESIGGHVHITNMPGKGSIFTISLPLTLAILDGMIVRVGAENYIIPITSIIETMRPKKEDIKKVEGRGKVINVRGEFVPLIFLNDIFGVKNSESDASKALVVLVESGKQKMGLVVDELIGQQQVVIKSLESNSDKIEGISGATILGDGKVSLILEINELKRVCQHSNSQKYNEMVA